MSSHNLHCKMCGEEFTTEDFGQLEFVQGTPVYKFEHEGNQESTKTGFVEVRRCSNCSHDVLRRIDYDPDAEPETERNPVPTMRPPPPELH